jgi:hypothetical protein
MPNPLASSGLNRDFRIASKLFWRCTRAQARLPQTGFLVNAGPVQSKLSTRNLEAPRCPALWMAVNAGFPLNLRAGGQPVPDFV